MVAAPASGVAYGTEWNDGVYMSQMRFDASYYVGVLGNAATRELRLEANSNDSNARITFYTGASGTTSERARIDSSGNLLVGTTSKFDIGRVCSLAADGVASFETKPNSNISYNAIVFKNSSNTTIGRVLCSTTGTSYETTSDYRLKNSVSPMTGALAKIALLKPCTYKWNADGSNGQGFIAHELAEVVPECVTGEKDAVNADGSIQPQGIDTSFLVATLTAAIQELKAEFDAYKASHP
jgi:hypothetical protein